MLTKRSGGTFPRRASGLRRLRRYEIDYGALDHLRRYPYDAQRLWEAIESAHGAEEADRALVAMIGRVPR